jgi:dolichyl-diphosphooligosaccharide--protein glycosyltransferase
MRSYPVKYGYYLNEFDPYFNFRATEFIIDHGLAAYWNWHDTMSWYPEGRDIAKTSQSALHITAAFTYNIFTPMISISLLDFTIILPVILGSMTTIIIFALVRTVGNSTTAGMFSALLFAFNPAIIQRGNLGWFKSEPLGLFFGLLALYLFVSAIKHKEIKFALPKALVGGLVLGFANASWGGAQYFTIPISLFLIVLPFFRKDTPQTIFPSYIAAAITFTIFTLVGVLVFPRPGVSFLFSLSGIALIGSTAFLFIAYFLRKISQPKREFRNILLLLVVFLSVLPIITASRTYYIHGPYLLFDLAPRYFSAINPFSSYQEPLHQSIAEHAKPHLVDYFQNYSTLLVFAAFGIWAALKYSNRMSVFALIIGLTGVYVSITLVRLLVFSSIGIIILAALGFYYITQIVLDFRKSANETDIVAGKSPKGDKIAIGKKKSELLSISNWKRDGRLVKIAYTMLIILILLFPMVYPRDSNWLSSADIPPTILTGGTDSVLKNNDWLNALHWISNNTPKDSVIAAWWDYGYWITTMANRTTLIDNAGLNTGVYKNHISSVANMFMEDPRDGVKIAQDLKANYILIFVVAQRVSVNGTSFYTLGYGGYEDKLYWFIRIGGLKNISEYLEADEFTPKPKFWNTTLIGKLLPFTLEGYTLFENEQTSKTFNNDTFFQKYKSDAIALYSKQIKYPESERDNGLEQQPFSLVYVSDSFTKSNQDRISAVLIYKINNNNNITSLS